MARQKKVTEAQRKQWAEDRKAKIEELQGDLVGMVEGLSDSGEWKRWLKQVATFHNYSFRNLMLILMQKPEATRCASYTAWKKLNRQVTKGQKGIRILAPMIVKDDQAPTEDETRCIGFRVVSTFDISQTEGEELQAAPISTVRGEEEAALLGWDRLVSYATENGMNVKVVSQGELGRANGSCDRQGNILVRSDLPPAHRLKTLAHEIAHFTLKHFDGDISRERAEVEAEGSAFVICGYLGVETEVYSAGYVLSWGKDTQVLLSVGESIRKASHKVLGALNEDGVA